MSSGFWIMATPAALGLLVGLLVGVPVTFLVCRAYWRGPRR